MQNLIFMFAAAVSAFAHGQDPYRARCERLLDVTIASLGDDPAAIRYLDRPAIGYRGFVAGRWPPVTGATEIASHPQGVVSWFHGIKVARSEAEARLDDQTRSLYDQANYLITDQSVDDLEPNEGVGELEPAVEAARVERIQRRFAEIFRDGSTRVVWFDEPRFDPEAHEYGELAVGLRQIKRRDDGTLEPRVIRHVPIDHARAVFHADEMNFISDKLGPRFLQYGWFRLPWRGLSDVETSFARSLHGSTPKSSFISDGYNLALQLVRDGYTFRVSYDVEDAIDLELRTIHGVTKNTVASHGQKKVVNSRYAKTQVRAMTIEAAALARAFAFELRDPQGVLRGSEIGFFGEGGHIIMDCISGMDTPKDPARPLAKKEKPFYPAIEVRKAVIAAGIVWARERGYPFTDSLVVTDFTHKSKAYYVGVDQFLAEIHAHPTPPRPAPGAVWVPPTYEQIYKRPRILPGAIR